MKSWCCWVFGMVVLKVQSDLQSLSTHLSGVSLFHSYTQTIRHSLNCHHGIPQPEKTSFPLHYGIKARKMPLFTKMGVYTLYRLVLF